jgi:outer membrane protein assembly factor BamA
MTLVSTLILCVLISLNVNAQLSLQIIQYNQTTQGIKPFNYRKFHNNEKNAEQEINRYLNNLIAQGYASASLDSLSYQENKMIAYVFCGLPYNWIKLSAGNVDEIILSKTGYREKLFRGKTFEHRKLEKMMVKMLYAYENYGYPFIRLHLDNIKIDGEGIEASLNTIKGNRYIIDSVNIKGRAKISSRYIENYIGIKPGDVYNEQLINALTTRVREIPFVREARPTQVIFLEDKAVIRLELNERKASQFNGMLGFLPNSDQTGKLLLTGEAVMKLRNSLGRGELIEAEWRRLQVATQRLDINVEYPFILNTPFGIDGEFHLYKRDSTFLNLQRNLGVQYLFGGNNYLKVFVENRSSSLLNTRNLQNITVLPDFADITSNQYGLELQSERLDYRFNPRKGYRLRLKASTGIRNIKQNSAINPSLYEGLQLRTIQWTGSADFDYFIPLGAQSAFVPGLLSHLITGENLFENELFLIGGFNSLRGFDDESIFASLFTMINLEYRYLFEENSYFSLFWNGAYYENTSRNRNIVDRPYGVGVGLSFETGAGIFNISYALGKQFDNPLQFRNARVHFGITSLF